MIERIRSRARPIGPTTSIPDPIPVEKRTPLFTEDLLTRFRHLVLHARQPPSAGLSGEHRSRRKGLSPEFSDFKSYVPGDDYRRIDWSAYARLDDLFIRESETTTEFDVHVLIDLSRSMDWTSSDALPTKLRHGLRLAGAIGYVALWHFDRMSLTPVASTASHRFGPVQGRSSVLALLRYLERLTPGTETDLVSAINRYVFLRKRPGSLFVISDFLSDDMAALETAAHGAATRGWDTVLLHIQDPAELDPSILLPDAETSQVADVERGDRMLLRGDAQHLEHYRAERSAWIENLQRLGGGLRVSYVPVSTAEPVEQIMTGLMVDFGLVMR
ncbi:MAG: DUF58 domain-containing protein [Chloroflexota bacterium]|nr:DUF58 domain-containing protein [Chloroflexota bacterium]